MFQLLFQVGSLLCHHKVYPRSFQLIIYSTTHSRDPTQSPSNKTSWISFFYYVQIPSGNNHRSLLQCPLCCKDWIPVEHQVILLLNNQVEYLPFPLIQFKARDLLTFLVVSQVTNILAVHKLVWLCIPFLFQVLNQPYCLQMLEV